MKVGKLAINYAINC